MSSRPWYHEGLRFRCLACGQCCTGAPGHVWLRAAEIAALAAALGMEAPAFEAAFVRTLGQRKSLTERDDGDCVLFDKATRRCTVYDARPAQCRTWPFWASNLRSPETWEETRQACPGTRRGPLVDRQQIDRQAAVVRL
jgi:Fe-S-cluster containining protein